MSNSNVQMVFREQGTPLSEDRVLRGIIYYVVCMLMFCVGLYVTGWTL